MKKTLSGTVVTPGPVVKVVITKSSNDSGIASMAPAKIPGNAIGKVAR